MIDLLLSKRARWCAICGTRYRWWRSKACHIEASEHEIGLLSGGTVIHYSTCWCKKERKS